MLQLVVLRARSIQIYAGADLMAEKYKIRFIPLYSLHLRYYALISLSKRLILRRILNWSVPGLWKLVLQ